MAAVFFVICAIATIWAAVKSQFIRREIIDTFPPQFQDSLSSRYAFDVYALAHSTPLPLQADYIKCKWAECIAMLSGALAFLSAGYVPLGCIGLIGFILSIVWAFKSRKTYEENCRRAEDKEQA